MHQSSFALYDNIIPRCLLVWSCLAVSLKHHYNRFSLTIHSHPNSRNAPVIDAYMSLGLIFLQSSQPSPIEVSFPETKFSTRISERSINRCMISRPSGFLKLTVIERLFRFIARKYADSGGRCVELLGAEESKGAEGGFQDPTIYEKSPAEDAIGYTQLVSSPFVTSSTFTTSAPRSASSIVAVGPASTRVRSRILIP